MDFLELQRDSRVTTGNSGCLLCWPREVQSSIRVAKEIWGLLSSDCRANRPHLGLCPDLLLPSVFPSVANPRPSLRATSFLELSTDKREENANIQHQEDVPAQYGPLQCPSVDCLM